MNIHLKYQALRDEKASWERKAEQAHRAYLGGLWGILIGLILLIFFWPLGVLLLLAGGLAAFTQILARSQARAQVTEREKQMRKLMQEGQGE